MDELNFWLFLFSGDADIPCTKFLLIWSISYIDIIIFIEVDIPVCDRLCRLLNTNFISLCARKVFNFFTSSLVFHHFLLITYIYSNSIKQPATIFWLPFICKISLTYLWNKSDIVFCQFLGKFDFWKHYKKGLYGVNNSTFMPSIWCLKYKTAR